MLQVQKIQFRPGIVKETTQYANSGGWYDCNFVRFRAGFPETIGGWSQLDPTVIGVPRSLHQWSSLVGTQNIGIGTHLKYYVLSSGTMYDITPQRAVIACGVDPFMTVADPFKLMARIPAHNCNVYDYVTFTGATTGVGSYSLTDLNCPTGQNYLPGQVQFQVSDVLDANTVLLKGTKNSGGVANLTGGGSNVICRPDMNGGLADAATPGGFGYGPWGGFYAANDSRNTGWGQGAGTPDIGDSPSVNQPTIWHHDNYGQDLVINPRGGSIYYWTANSGSPTTGYTGRAVTLQAAAAAYAATNGGTADANIPANSNGVFVSPISQIVVAVGCTPYGSKTGLADPMQIRWSDTLSLTTPAQFTWSPDRTNAAGGQRLSSGSYIVGYLPSYAQTLIWTDTSLYTMTYSGSPYVFGFQIVASGISLIGPNAAVSNGSTTFWMDINSFRVYNGAVQELPCAVKQYVFSGINRKQAWKSFAAHNHNFSEVWFFYPRGREIDSYVIYNYQDNSWSVGTLSRTTWLDPGRTATPIAGDATGALYLHENGTDANGQPLQAYIESADIDINGGDQYAFLQKVIPDLNFTGTAANPLVTVDLMWRNSGNDAKTIQRSLPVTPTTEYLYGRVRGRRLSVRFGSSMLGCGWRLGNCEAEIEPNGRR